MKKNTNTEGKKKKKQQKAKKNIFERKEEKDIARLFHNTVQNVRTLSLDCLNSGRRRGDSKPEESSPTDPESVPLRLQFLNKRIPCGEILAYPSVQQCERETALESLDDRVSNLRIAAEAHRQTRLWVQSWIKPGMRMLDIADRLESKLEALIEKKGLDAGQAFPTGCSLNHVAAHWTPNSRDNTVLAYGDVCKIDFGAHVNGHIIDCAWTVSFDPVYDPLLDAVKAATEEGIRCAGIDVRLSDIGTSIQEVMEAHEVEINGRVYPVKCIRNLNGHSMEPYKIHAGKSVPIVKTQTKEKMEEGEQYAIETFGTTGRGVVEEDLECSHYMMRSHAQEHMVRLDKAKKLLRHIKQTYSTLAFCRKWLDRGGFERHLIQLNALVEAGVVERYPPLCDVEGSFTAQYEHTILLRPTCKEVLSRGSDY